MFEHDERLAKWFLDNDGVISLGGASKLGVDHRAMSRRADAGVLVRAHPGVYRSAAVQSTFASRLRAAIEAAPADAAWVSGPSLMRLYGVRGEWDPEPEITLLGTEHLELDGVRVRRIDRIEERDIHRRNGLPVLAPPLGLLTLGATQSTFKVVTAVHDMVFLGFTARPQLIDTLKRYEGQGRRGVVKYRKGVRTLSPDGRGSQSTMELVVAQAAVAAGLPRPHLQFPVVDGDGKSRKLDLAWPHRRFDLETDGDRWHLNPYDRAEMKRRDAALRAVGYEVLRVDSDQVDHHLRAVIAELQRFVGRSRP